MADLGNYTPEFLAAWAMYNRAFKKIQQATIDNGCHERDVFLASGPGSKILGYKAWMLRLLDSYNGCPLSGEMMVSALSLMLTSRLQVIRTSRRANLGYLSTELNKESFADFIELAYEQAEEKRLAEGAN
jgi:hypothetical protein